MAKENTYDVKASSDSPEFTIPVLEPETLEEATAGTDDHEPWFKDEGSLLAAAMRTRRINKQGADRRKLSKPEFADQSEDAIVSELANDDREYTYGEIQRSTKSKGTVDASELPLSGKALAQQVSWFREQGYTVVNAPDED